MPTQPKFSTLFPQCPVQIEEFIPFIALDQLARPQFDQPFAKSIDVGHPVLLFNLHAALGHVLFKLARKVLLEFSLSHGQSLVSHDMKIPQPWKAKPNSRLLSIRHNGRTVSLLKKREFPNSRTAISLSRDFLTGYAAIVKTVEVTFCSRATVRTFGRGRYWSLYNSPYFARK